MDNRRGIAGNVIVDPKGSTFAAVFLAIMIFARCMPFYLWAIEDYQRIFCSIAVPLVCFFNMRINKENRLHFILFFVSFLVLGLHREGILRFLNALLLCFIPFLNEGFLKKAYGYFNKIFCFLLVLSLINFAFYLLGASPIATIAPLNSLKSYDYGAFPFLVVGMDDMRAFPRFCGLFDEPGVIGTLAGIMLFINRFEMKRWYNIALMLGGVLSFSLFFYVIIVLAPFILSGNAKTRMVSVVVLGFGLLIVLYNPVLYDLIGYRLNWNSAAGVFAGDTRSNTELSALISAERFSWSYWWGHPMADEYIGQSSLLLFGYIQGFLFVFLNIAAYVVMSFKKIWSINKIDFVLFVLLLMACVYQRPYLFDINYIFLFTCLVYSIKDAAIINGSRVVSLNYQKANY